MYEKFGQFIDGKWQQSASGETYDVINPATEELIGKASKANDQDVQRALMSAKKGLDIWSKTSPWERSKIIRKISELMKKRVDVLSKWLTLEVGKPITEGPGEIGGAADTGTGESPRWRKQQYPAADSSCAPDDNGIPGTT